MKFLLSVFAALVIGMSATPADAALCFADPEGAAARILAELGGPHVEVAEEFVLLSASGRDRELTLAASREGEPVTVEIEPPASEGGRLGIRVRGAVGTFSVPWELEQPLQEKADTLFEWSPCEGNAQPPPSGTRESAGRGTTGDHEQPAPSKHRWWMLGLFLMALLLPRREEKSEPRPMIRATQLLPFSLQTIIFSYWALHCLQVRDYIPFVIEQLVFGVLLEAALSRRRYGRFLPSFGVVPLVLSTNLFMQYVGAYATMQVLAIGIAIMSKEFFTRDGRHIFNPSAFGISVIALVSLTFPATGNGDVSHLFATPPNMSELLLLLALVVQLRVPVVLTTLSCALTVSVISTPGAGFEVTWAPVLLVLTLLITDPATSPRSPVGRVLFGVSAGVLMVLVSGVLSFAGFTDFFSKILPIPVVNFFVPAFDRIGRRWAERNPPRVRAILPAFNRWHVAFWFVAGNLWIAEHKDRMDEDRMVSLRSAEAPIVEIEPDGTIECARNPAYCRPFAIGAEIAAWRSVGRD